MTHPISAVLGGGRCEMLEMPWPDYLAFPGLNGSTIVKGSSLSMLHLKHAWDQGEKDSDNLRFGRMMHTLLFEPHTLDDRVRVWDGGVRRGKKYEDFCIEAEMAGADVVKAHGEFSLDAAVEAAQSFLRSRRVQELIRAGKAEQTLLCDECGIQCKGRIDWISSLGVLTDLKTTASLTEHAFGKAFNDYGYGLKLGLYQRWLKRVTGVEYPVEIIAMENKPPYDLVPVPVPPNVLEQGVEKALGIIRRVKECIKKDEWPGMEGSEKPFTLKLPFYAMEEEETVEFEG